MKISQWMLVLCAVLLAFGTSGCSTPPAPSAAVTDAEPRWVRTELYFSIGDWMESALSTDAEERWQAFLDREVTPRFPDGLTVIDVYGQWRSAKPGAPVLRERSRLLVILHPDTPETNAKIEELRGAWKQPTGEESVLWVSQPAEVRF